MNSDYTKVKLGDVAEIFSGFAFKSSDLVDEENESIPIIKIANIQDKKVLKKGNGFLPKTLFKDKIGRYKLDSDDFLVAMTGAGSVGKVGKMRNPDRLYLVNQRVGLVRPNIKKVSPEYLFQALSSNYYEEYLYQLGTGSGQPNVSATDIGNLEVPFPNLKIQQKIASILSAFDYLIENNTRRIEILEEMARRIYREWFVHFRYPGHEEDELVDSGTELGEIPEGWAVRKLLDVCNLQTGKALKSKQFNEDGIGAKAVRIRNVRTNSSDTFTDEELDDKYIVKNGDILVGMDGDFHMCRWADGKSVLVQRVARFRPKKKVCLSKYFFFWAIKKPVNYFDRTITGTTVAHLGKKHIKTIEVLLPSENLRKRINKILDPIYKKELLLRQKNKKLKETRDLLLPKLISGEVNVNELVAN